MRRAYEKVLTEFLRLFPCVALIGPRQCGKTTLLQRLPSDWRRLDLERVADRQSVTVDPDLFLRLHPARVAFDEVQAVPALFPALRVAIDANRGESGRFVLTGSSSPELLQAVSETLAGRIGIIEMAPFSLAEIHPRNGPGLVELLACPATEPEKIVRALGAPRCSVQQVHQYWLRGGYPEPWI